MMRFTLLFVEGSQDGCCCAKPEEKSLCLAEFSIELVLTGAFPCTSLLLQARGCAQSCSQLGPLRGQASGTRCCRCPGTVRTPEIAKLAPFVPSGRELQRVSSGKAEQLINVLLSYLAR